MYEPYAVDDGVVHCVGFGEDAPPDCEDRCQSDGFENASVVNYEVWCPSAEPQTDRYQCNLANGKFGLFQNWSSEIRVNFNSVVLNYLD